MKIRAYNRIAKFHVVPAFILVGIGGLLSAGASPSSTLNQNPMVAQAATSLVQEQASTGRTSVPRASVGKTSAGAAGNVLVAADEDYKIGSGDVVEIEIEDAPELSGTFRINSKGTFLMHYLGRITAKNKTTEELAKFIHDGLNQRYIFDPHVTVVVKQYNSRSFFVQGAVQAAGVYQIEGRPTLLELVTLAGGLQANHGSTAFIIRKIKEKDEEASSQVAVAKEQDNNQVVSTTASSGTPKPQEASLRNDADDPTPQYTLQKVNINGLLKGRFEQNMFLEPGDIVNIPQSEVFFVAGDVKAPGSFPLKEGTTLRQALTLAQGLNFTAAGRGAIFRENLETGKRQEIEVNFGNVMKGKEEDLVILPNDIVLVHHSKFKKATAPILSAFAVNSVLLPMRF